MDRLGGILTAWLWLALLAPSVGAFGLDPESNVDGFEAGFNPAEDTYEINEARRQNLISRQLDLNNTLLWLTGHAGIWGSEPPVRQPIGQESIQVSPNKWIYRPLYAEDVQPRTETLPAPQPLAAPPAAQPKQPQAPANSPATKPAPQAPAPADAVPGDQVPPKALPKQTPAPKQAPARGPRVF